MTPHAILDPCLQRRALGTTDYSGVLTSSWALLQVVGYGVRGAPHPARTGAQDPSTSRPAARHVRALLRCRQASDAAVRGVATAWQLSGRVRAARRRQEPRSGAVGRRRVSVCLPLSIPSCVSRCSVLRHNNRRVVSPECGCLGVSRCSVLRNLELVER